MNEKSNYRYTVLGQDALAAQPVGDVEAGYQYPVQRRRSCTKWKRFFVFGIITYFMMSLVYHFSGHHCKHFAKDFKWGKFAGNKWISHHHNGGGHQESKGMAISDMSIFDVEKHFGENEECKADIKVDGLPTHEFDATVRQRINLSVEGAIHAKVKVVPTESKQAKFEAQVFVSDENMVSQISIDKAEVDEDKINLVLKAPKAYNKDQCATAKVVLYVPSNIVDIDTLNIGFSIGKFKVDKQIAKNIRFGNFRVGSINGHLKIPHIQADSVVIDNVIGDINTELSVSDSVTLRTVKGNIDANIDLEHGDQENLTFDSVVGGITTVISENFAGRFRAISASDDIVISDEGKDGHLHFDKDFGRLKTGSRSIGSDLDDGKARLTVNNVRGGESITFA